MTSLGPIAGPPQRVLLVAGTRPEVIKLSALAHALSEGSPPTQVLLADSAQHEALTQALWAELELTPTHRYTPCPPGPRQAALLGHVIAQTGELLERERVDAVIVQGDTSTALGAAWGAFYHHTPVIHLEAGLRTPSVREPWPEEAHRRAITTLASLHLVPSPLALQALRREGVPEADIRVVGNTVIDAVLKTAAALRADQTSARALVWSALGQPLSRPYLLVTAHRRESFRPEAPSALALGLGELARQRRDLDWVVPLHPNPDASRALRDALGGLPHVHLISPQPYRAFVALMMGAQVILTDSGGVQEEAAALGVPLLVLRARTERVELLHEGAGQLLAPDAGEGFVARAMRHLQALPRPGQPARVALPYGQGDAGQRAARAVHEALARWRG